MAGEWPRGLQCEITVRNTGDSAINGWTLRRTFPDGRRISILWGGTASQSGAEVTVASASYTAAIPAVGSVTPWLHGHPAGREPPPHRVQPERFRLLRELTRGAARERDPRSPPWRPQAAPDRFCARVQGRTRWAKTTRFSV
ncbi:cellulose binding domain-containing protein [Streptomyces sp. NPDC005931]|uniref:cellulose binding domain-containing protein n=1 Tax=Streptomyces sp. NPDC005931 TaxID=3364737 RepID=UPI0036BA2ED5